MVETYLNRLIDSLKVAQKKQGLDVEVKLSTRGSGSRKITDDTGATTIVDELFTNCCEQFPRNGTSLRIDLSVQRQGFGFIF